MPQQNLKLLSLRRELQDTLTTDTVDFSLTTAGETWRCVVMPNDDTVDGPPAQDRTITVETLTTETITSGTPDDTLDTKVDIDSQEK